MQLCFSGDDASQSHLAFDLPVACVASRSRSNWNGMGKHMVCSPFFLLEFAADTVLKTTWQALEGAILKRLREMNKKAPVLSHSEGFSSGCSGVHPIGTLSRSSLARNNFDAIVTGRPRSPRALFFIMCLAAPHGC